MKTLRYGLLVVGMSLFSGCSWFNAPEEKQGIKAGTSENAPIRITTKAELENYLKSEKFVVVDFFATWCPPCQTMLPINEKMAEKFKNVRVLEVNIDEGKELRTEHGVMGVPTFFFFKDGTKVLFPKDGGQTTDRKVGVMSEAEYEEKIRVVFGI